MRVTLTFEIDTDTARPDDLAQLIAHALALRDMSRGGPAPAPAAPSRRSREPGDDDFDDPGDVETGTDGPKAEEADDNRPTDRRQLLGWASKQHPDRKGNLLAFGRKKGYPTKIISWTPD